MKCVLPQRAFCSYKRSWDVCFTSFSLKLIKVKLTSCQFFSPVSFSHPAQRGPLRWFQRYASSPHLYNFSLYLYRHQWLFCVVFSQLESYWLYSTDILLLCAAQFFVKFNHIYMQRKIWFIYFNHSMVFQPTNIQHFYLSTDWHYVFSNFFDTENNTATHISMYL